jgi:large subunit ribosomal protein L21
MEADYRKHWARVVTRAPVRASLSARQLWVEGSAAPAWYTQRLCGYRGAAVPCLLQWAGGITERADMYAVIKTGGKQYKVAAGEKIKIEQIAADVGQEITIDQILAVGDGADLKVGTPLVVGASVIATVVAHGRHDKVRIFKMRRRKHYQKRQGHRQNFTEIQIGAVNA